MINFYVIFTVLLLIIRKCNSSKRIQLSWGDYCLPIIYYRLDRFIHVRKTIGQNWKVTHKIDYLCLSELTLNRYAHYRNIGQPNNLRVFRSNTPKVFDSQKSAKVSYIKIGNLFYVLLSISVLLFYVRV
jgi:hypothetical protein